ncbi:MAG: dephospho-CoA kinase [Arenicella sp.]
MIRITGRRLSADTHAAHYRIAGQQLVCQEVMDGLAAYACDVKTQKSIDLAANFVEPAVMTATNYSPRYSGGAFFDSKFREVQYWRSQQHGQLDIDGVPACQINFSEPHIHMLNTDPLGVGLNLELITGPALVLLLSLGGTYCMHAGAVDTAAVRIGIIAESGAGKSTLSQHVDDGWRQVSDDIMPLQISNSGSQIEVFTDFPQLKLSNNKVQHSDSDGDNDGGTDRKKLDYLLRINPVPGKSISFSRLPRVQAMLQVVRHTVAAKLFDATTLREHARFAKKVSTLVPVIEVSYPRDLDKLDQLRHSIIDYLRSVA